MQIQMLAIKPDEWPQNLAPIQSTWSHGVPDPRDAVWKDIGELFQRKWFERVWVVKNISRL